MRIRTKIWIENDDGEQLLGQGRLTILEAISRTGSLSAAARELGMSYRALWGKVRSIEQRLGFTLVQGTAGGSSHGGAVLTDEARDYMDRFARFNERAIEAVDRLAAELLPEDFGAPTDRSDD